MMGTLAYIRSFLPDTHRAWVGFVIWMLLVPSVIVLGTYVTIREQNKTRDLREWRYWAKTALESKSAVIVVNADTGLIEGWNASATELLGWGPQDVVGRPFTFLVPEEAVQEQFGSLPRYFDRATSPDVADRLLGTVLAISGPIKTSTGQIDSRISIRTLPGPKYVVTVDAVETVAEIGPIEK